MAPKRKAKGPAAPAMLSQAELKKQALEIMEDDLRIKPRQAQDFINAVVAVVQEAVGDGRPVSVFGIVSLRPGFKLAKPRRKGRNPQTGEEVTLKASPAATKIRATVGKRIKDALPKAKSAAGEQLQAVQEYKAKEAAKRAKAREKEEANS